MKMLKEAIVRSAYAAGEGHIPSALSVLDIIWILYDRILKVDPARPNDPARDRFFLSKGHASLALYAVLARKGFFPMAELSTFCGFNSRFGGHPDRNKVPGVEASTGSLGHGFPMAVGAALGLMIQKNPAGVVSLIGDGEANEGTVWESALLAAHHGLHNLTCIVDYNHSTDRALRVGDLTKKFEAFGWHSIIVNGHNHEALYAAITAEHPDGPLVVIAETVKGNGLKLMENNPAWHHKAPSPEELEAIIKELI